MAQLPSAFNTANNNEKMSDFSAMPAGKYPAVIVKSEYKKNKAKNGNYLDLQHKVIDGEHKGRVFFNKLNLDNVNPTAVQIANKTLNSICEACGKVGVLDSDELHGIPMLVTLKLKAATAAYPASNDVGFYEKYTGTAEAGPASSNPTAGNAAGPAKTTTPPAGAIKSKLPWEK